MLLTFELSNGNEIDIHGDASGLRRLAETLQRVLDSGEHEHLMTPSWGGTELSEEKQSDQSALVHKVTIHLWS